MLIVYVGDIVIMGDNSHEIEKLKHQLREAFEVKDLRELRYFLGVEVARSKEGIFLRFAKGNRQNRV